MKVNTVIKYYGSGTEVARVLKCSKAAVSVWKVRGKGRRKGNVPIEVAIRLNRLSEGKLEIRLKDYA